MYSSFLFRPLKKLKAGSGHANNGKGGSGGGQQQMSTTDKNPVMLLNELRPGLNYEVGESGETPVTKRFIMTVKVEEQTFEGSGKRGKLSWSWKLEKNPSHISLSVDLRRQQEVSQAGVCPRRALQALQHDVYAPHAESSGDAEQEWGTRCGKWRRRRWSRRWRGWSGENGKWNGWRTCTRFVT